MTERLTTEDFANRKRDDETTTDQTTADYQEPVENYEQEPTGYDQEAPADYDRGQYDRGQYDEGAYDTADRTDTQTHAVPQQDRQEQQPVQTDQPAQTDQPEQQPTGMRSDDEPLFAPDEADGFRTEWRTLQSDFVDDPRDAVRRADELVAQVVQSLATTFADHKRSLEGQWQQGEQVDTEELRNALRRYRAFFDRLLSV
ncbi:hypothetical protein [Saccharothrix variisporea]|uniref:Uncharacterized protein n=1 Tax=Saccharothrix variisporea TaxID=543527 RepID=A0A495X831_9PSEU|nr:hypothetical protein [Saccharothrix variisporea]RKT69719.1 hypothetical protein DFJ66_2957 [Saccharothrix variisporea]